ncbi:MAG TPA: FlgD immunoglobulin-like domain containing protein [Gaiellaceae bacterium]|nr:FlgD immunoglobulin-like domain containing protein [Gaiellaceae bacterium]
MARFAPAALVAVLLVATAAAFAYTERLKLTPSPILGTRVLQGKVFSPTCECTTDAARFTFRLRRRDRVTVTIVDGGGDVVRTLVTDQPRPRGGVRIVWDGYDDLGRVVPDGSYRPRVKLALNRRTIVLPNPLRVDTTPPRVELRGVRPRVFSPDGDNRADRVVVGYRVDERARVALYVDGRRAVRKKGTKTEGTIDWFGRVQGRRVDRGAHALSLVARDVAGNLGEATPAAQVVLRYIALGRERIVTAPGRRFALLVSADAARVQWRLAGRTGSVRPGTVRLRAPKRPGRYTLTLREHGHAVRAAVIVRAT